MPETPGFELPSDLVGIDFLVPPSPPAVRGPVEFRSEMVRPVRISGGDPHYTEIARSDRDESSIGALPVAKLPPRERNTLFVPKIMTWPPGTRLGF